MVVLISQRAGGISQYLALPEVGEWGVTIALQADDGPYFTTNDGEVTVSLGNASITEDFTNQRNIVKLLDLGPFDPTTPTVAPDVYRLQVTNAESFADQTGRTSMLIVAFVCLYEWDGGSTPPSTCYFPDPNFDEGTGWTLGGGASIATQNAPFEDQNNYLSLPDGGSAYTTFSLSGYEDVDATYRVRFVGTTSALDAMDDPGALTIDFNATDAEGDMTEIASVDGGWLSWSLHTFIYTVPVAETYTGTFSLINTTGEAFDIRLDDICLQPVNGQWPGYGGTTPGAIPVVPESCAIVPRGPVTAEVNAWVAWVGALIRYFWTCQAPLWVSQILSGIDGIQDWLAMLGRWLAIVFYTLMQLMWDLTQFGVYQSYNLTVDLVEAVWGVSSGAITLPWDGFSLLVSIVWTLLIGAINLIWAVFSALMELAWTLLLALIPLIWGVFSSLVVAFWSAIISLPLINLFSMGATITALLFGIVTETINLIITAFQVLATMAQIVGSFFASITLAFNSTETADVGMIDCPSMLDTDPMIGWCLGIEVTEYFIDSFPAMNILGLAIMGALAYHTISLTIEWYREAFAEAS